jgi:hypothetical protein
MVEARPIVFMGNVGSEFQKLVIVEMLFESGEQLVVDMHRGGRHLIGIVQQQLFRFRKSFIAKARDSSQLRIAQASFSAHGRADVQSKRAAYAGRGSQLHQGFKPVRNVMFAIQEPAHQRGRPQNIWDPSLHFQRCKFFPKPALGQSINPTNAPSRIAAFQWLDSRHDNPS